MDEQSSKPSPAGLTSIFGIGLALATAVAGLLLFMADTRYVRPGEAREVAKDVVQAEAQSKAEAARVETINRSEHEGIRREIADRLGRIETRQTLISATLDKLQANIERMQQGRRGARSEQ